MKKVDVYNHIFPKRYWDKMIEIAGDLPDMGKRVRGVPMLMDLDERWRVMDMFEDYYQILSIANPPIEAIAGPDASPGLAAVGNDGMAELCEKHPDRFAGFTASLPMNNPDAAVEEVHRAVKELGAAGVQFFTDVNDESPDDP